MIKLINKIKKANKLVIAVVFVAAFAVPTVVQAYSGDVSVQNEEVAETEVTGDENTGDKPEIILVNDEQEVNNDEEVTVDEDTTVETETEAVDIPGALALAETEHSGSVVVMIMLKQHDGQPVYKFYFRDGWKVVVRISDGEILKSVDTTTKRLEHKKNHLHKKLHRHSAWHKFHQS